MTSTDNFVATTNTAQSGAHYAELYSEHFTTQPGAVHGSAPAQAMPSTPFKIFSLTNDNVNIIYTNQAGM